MAWSVETGVGMEQVIEVPVVVEVHGPRQGKDGEMCCRSAVDFVALVVAGFALRISTTYVGVEGGWVVVVFASGSKFAPPTACPILADPRMSPSSMLRYIHEGVG